MARTKNSDRRKRKYGDKQKARTARNKANAQARHERREARMEERTILLVGEKVKFGPGLTGEVISVLDHQSDEYPKVERNDKGKVTFKPRGRYLVIKTKEGVFKRPRRAVKPA